MVPKRIYLAGPEVFLPDPSTIAALKKQICADHGFEGVFPADADPEFDGPEAGRRISKANERLIESCDALIANMTPFRGPSMDVGTAYEMGFMRALGRPVLGYSNVEGEFRARTVHLRGGRREGDHWVDDDGLRIEDFGLSENLMLDGAVFDGVTEIVRHSVSHDRLFEDLRGFIQCVEMVKAAIARNEEQRRTYYEARRWTWARAVETGRHLAEVSRNDPRQIVSIAGRHLEGLHILRVPLITLLLLAALPFLAFGRARSLLENLFVDFGVGAILVTTLVSFLTAASAVAVINAILVNGHERFPWLPMGKYYGGPFHWLAFLAPAPLVWTIVQRAQTGTLASWLAVLAAVVIGSVVLLWIRIEQGQRSERLRQTFPTWTSRPLVYPHPLPFDAGAARPPGRPAAILQGPIGRCVLPVWWMACVAYRLRYVLSSPMRQAAASRAGRWTVRAGGGIKRLMPEAGLVYVRTREAQERPFYSAPHYLLLFSIVLFVAWVILSVGAFWFEILVLPTLAYLVFTLWVGCLIVSAVTFLLDRYRIPLLTLLVIWALVGARLFPNDHYYDTRQAAVDATNVALEPPSLLDARDSGPVILVAAAGGGIQAAAWTARVLTGLAQELPDTFARSIVLLSGVSGGAAGVYHFTDAYGGSDAVGAVRLGRAYAAASASSLEHVAAGMVSIDLVRGFLPFPLPGSTALFDRGWALERAFDRRSAVPGTTIAAWERDVLARRRPAVIFNATLVESGVPLLFATTRFPSRPGGPASYDAVDFRTLQFVEAGKPPRAADIPLATAVRLSASFPFVTPVATSNLAGPIELSAHVADGGYYDNFGMMSLMAWLNDGLERASRPPARVLVLQIRSFPDIDAREREAPRSSFFQTYAPLTTLTSVRNAAQQLRNEQEFGYLQRYWQGHKDGTPVTIRTRLVDFVPDRANADREPPLSWRLNLDQRDDIERTWRRIKGDAVEDIRKFLEPEPRSVEAAR